MAEVRRPVRFGDLLRALVEGDVDFIVVGGVAAVLEGALVSTFDLDIVYALDERYLVSFVAVDHDSPCVGIEVGLDLPGGGGDIVPHEIDREAIAGQAASASLRYL